MTKRSTLPRRLARGGAALGALILTVALTGCLKMTMDFTVQDQTVSGPMVVAVDREALELAQQFDPEASPEDILEDLDADLDADVEGVTAEPYEDDRYVGTRYVYDNVPLDQLNDSWGDDPDAMQITYDPATDTYEVTGTMDLSEAEADVGEETDDFLPPGFMDNLMGSFDMRLSITFPGEVVETTGEVSGTTVTWTPTVGERLEIQAVAMASGGAPGAGGPADGDDGAADEGAPAASAGDDDSSGGGTVLLAGLIGLGVLALLAAVGVGIWLLRRSGGAAPASSGPAAPGAESTAYSGAAHHGAPGQPAPTDPAGPAPGYHPSPSPSPSDSGGSAGSGDGGGSS